MLEAGSLKKLTTICSITAFAGDGVAIALGNRMALAHVDSIEDDLIEFVSDLSRPWDDLVRGLAKRIVSANYVHPAITLLELNDKDSRVFMFGETEAIVRTETGEETLATAEMSTWLDTVVAEAPLMITLGNPENKTETVIGKIVTGTIRCGGFSIAFDAGQMRNPPAKQATDADASTAATPPPYEPPDTPEAASEDPFENDGTTALTKAELQQALEDAKNS